MRPQRRYGAEGPERRGPPRRAPPRKKKVWREAPERPVARDGPKRDGPGDDRFRREHRPAAGQGLAGGRPQVEGRRAVLEAFRSGIQILHLRVSDAAEPSPTLEAVFDEARARRVLIEKVPPASLDAQSETGRHQGVIADVVLPEPLSLDELLKLVAERGGDPFFVVLDRVEDPQNLGAIARSAEAAGASGLILPERHSAQVSPGSLRASAGAILMLPVAVVANTTRALETLKARGIWIAGADPEGEKPYHKASLSGPLALVIGGEHRGLHRLVRERCDFLVKVPLEGRVESLNASAAAAVVLFEIARQRAVAASVPEPHTKTPK